MKLTNKCELVRLFLMLITVIVLIGKPDFSIAMSKSKWNSIQTRLINNLLLDDSVSSKIGHYRGLLFAGSHGSCSRLKINILSADARAVRPYTSDM